MTTRLEVSRLQVLSFRRGMGHLDERLPAGAESLRWAAWAGLQDSAPRAALLSIHARVENALQTVWEHESLVQLWGPRFNVYAIASKDLAIFSLGRLPMDARRRTRAQHTAERLDAFLQGESMPFGSAGRRMGVVPNSLRYAAPTGRVLLHWDGAHQPVIWTIPAPRMAAKKAQLELARRYLHVCGPATSASFAEWAGVPDATAQATFSELAAELVPVRTPAGEGWSLAEDEVALRARPTTPATVRLLPSGDAFYLAWGKDREVLVPDARQRRELWTSRVWPGALLVAGEIAGVWRRSNAEITIETWWSLNRKEREAVESEAASLPLPGMKDSIAVRWR